MKFNDTSDDLAAAELGSRVFLLTDSRINTRQIVLGTVPHGSFPELMEYLRTET